MRKTVFLFFAPLLCLSFLHCGKSAGLPAIPIDAQPAPLVDPANWSPSVVQTNTNAKQFNYGKVKVVAGLSVLLSGMGITEMSSNNIHVYLRSTSGAYLHLPATSAAGVTYTYFLKAANPNSALFINRGAGVQETYDDIIILAAKTSYIQSLSSPINFAVYGTAKTKLGF